MFIKLHEPNPYITYLLSVDGRITFHDNDRIYLYRYQLGLEGERIFYQQLKDIMEGVKLWDVTLDEHGQSQYDFLIVVNRVIYHIDIKNFSGSYAFKTDNFISSNGRNYKNIMSQLQAAHDRLERIVKQQGWPYEVVSRILFINPHFSITNYDGNPNIWFSNQLDPFIKNLQQNTTYKMDLIVAEQLLSLHRPFNYERIHYYPFEQMKPGIRCPRCRNIGKMKVPHNTHLIYCKCGHSYVKKEMLMEVCKELSIINKGKLTVRLVCMWSGIPERSVRRFLSTHFQAFGQNKGRYYMM
ncbi:nuclease-related domain-containing protein [Macrococcoides caseolyticum]|uniref:nuclease-related domain-containing protein n=1 Tax=Macrococcoides caseolyticum TaxID=69966 RepID=UPI001F173C79|nr:nuclease-related domain-containing protein [Macrococcus caseolyticus]MCE4955739.1 NERD domain-containing protein [Macrococcus caseolyticus]